MIRLITGVPGSGKSYFAVYEIAKLFYRYDEHLHLFHLKNKKTLLLHNIEDLKLDGAYHIDVFLKDYSITFYKLFTVDFMSSLAKKYDKIVIFLDEAQRYFPKTFKQEEVLFFFQYHRHLGVNIYLVTQDIKLICPSIVSLIEFEIRAVRRSLRFSSSFRYHFVSSGEVISKKSLPADPKIFALYKSFESSDEGIAREVNPMRKYLFIFIILLCACVGGFYLFLHSFFSPKSSVSASASSSGSSSSRPARASAVSSSRASSLQPTTTTTTSSSPPSVSRVSSFSRRVRSPSLSAVSFSPASLGKEPFVLVKIGRFPRSGVIDAGGETLFLVFGRIFRKSELPYPLIETASGYFLQIPSHLVRTVYRSYFIEMEEKQKFLFQENSAGVKASAPGGFHEAESTNWSEHKRAEGGSRKRSEAEASGANVTFSGKGAF